MDYSTNTLAGSTSDTSKIVNITYGKEFTYTHIFYEVGGEEVQVSVSTEHANLFIKDVDTNMWGWKTPPFLKAGDKMLNTNEQEIEITSGVNIFNLPEGLYQITFPVNGEMIPWGKSIELSQNSEFIVPYVNGNPQILHQFWPWSNSVGSWYLSDGILRSQSSVLYENSDTSQSLQWMESDLIDVTGKNRIVLSFNHKYETEWDFDPITISLLDGNDSTLAEKSWTGTHWDEFYTEFLTATTDTEFEQVKVHLEFFPDQTVNYRGWEIDSITLFSIVDQYLDVSHTGGTIAPKIPMKINSLYPNPSNGMIQIDLSNFPGGFANIRVFNLLGQEIYYQKIMKMSPGNHFINLNLENLNGLNISSGMIFIRLESAQQQIVKKCVILNN